MKTFKQLRESTRKTPNPYMKGKKVGSKIAKGIGKFVGGAAKVALAPVKLGAKIGSGLARGIVKTGSSVLGSANRQIKSQAQRATAAQKHSHYVQTITQRKNLRHIHAIRRRQK